MAVNVHFRWNVAISKAALALTRIFDKDVMDSIGIPDENLMRTNQLAQRQLAEKGHLLLAQDPVVRFRLLAQR